MSNIPLTEAAAEPKVLDIQHDTDPAQDHGTARRIPHLGHAVLFFSLALTATLLCLVVMLLMTHLYDQQSIESHPLLLLGVQALAYVLTLSAAAWLFPRLWGKSFLDGIEWNMLAARRRWFWVMPAGIALSAAAQAASTFLPKPPKDPIEQMMMTHQGAWALTLFGVLMAPLIEEIAFRGFLLPALATAYDWIMLERTPAGLQRWESSTMHSRAALIFGAVMCSTVFALFHGSQLSFLWGPMAVLFVFSLAASYVRIRMHSVACSTLFHAMYNFTIFAVLFVGTDGFRHMEKLVN
jgi:membrane protease YdiL (CAAX protease family)